MKASYNVIKNAPTMSKRRRKEIGKGDGFQRSFELLQLDIVQEPFAVNMGRAKIDSLCLKPL